MQPKEWITVKEAAALTGRSTRAVYEWIQNGHLATIRDGENRTLVLSKATVRLAQTMRRGRPRGKPTRRA